MNLNDKTIAIIGSGYENLPLAVEFGKTRSVLGFNIKPDSADEVRITPYRTLECSPEALRSTIHLNFTAYTTVVARAGVRIVAEPTPVDGPNRADMQPVVGASHAVVRAVWSGYVVIYKSTVYPGANAQMYVPVLERRSDLAFNHDFFCGYSHDRISPGNEVNTITSVEQIISGSTPQVADAAESLYA